ncbi:general transcription factor 3C polypeptide 1 isoform X2 [Amphiprion ocellaris]|uniref:general transcription factor 3C polypeptide 1 isoform X2 n=1 Tax=Amphiprion ocellaris TaxID=80972 RepID=UPI0024116E39|nr:general transcription factor 3C polypeptide 1 isoform X2 [Amphiprion ocellaris]
MDPWSIVPDEVALEGLDGITIPTLWIRLENREPKFPLKLDDCTKELIWKYLASNTDLKFYELPKEREDVVLFDRFQDPDAEKSDEITHKTLETHQDIYPIHVVPENKDRMQGSCAHFKERKDVTKHIRSKSLTLLINLEEALERFGRKLVVVASQTLRFRTLIGSESDPDLKLTDDSYCVLERVGRARWQGELQRDLHGGSFKRVDARKFHYLRKSLVRHQLVTMQAYIRRLESGQQQHSILLLLKRFHINRRTKYDVLMEYVSNCLQQSPGQFATMMMFKAQLQVNESTFRRLFKYMRAAKLIEFCQYPLEELDPSAGPCTNKNGSKVLVRCVRLIKPYAKKGIPDDEDDDDDEDEEDDAGGRTGGFPSEGRIMERDIMSQAYHLILSSGTKGIPQRDIVFRMNISKLEARMLCRRLEKDGFIKGFLEDEGRQRTTKFISHKCVGVSDRLQMFDKERERTKQLYSSAPQSSNTEPNSTTASLTPKSGVKGKGKSPADKKNKKAGGGDAEDAEEAEQVLDDRKGEAGDGQSDRKGGKAKEKSAARRPTAGEKDSMATQQTQPGMSIMQSTLAECETLPCSESMTSMTRDSESIPAPVQASVDEEIQSSSTSASSLPQREVLNPAENSSDNNSVVVKSVFQSQGSVCEKSKKSLRNSHETYRLLRRKNLIVEAVRNFKIIEGLFPLQKIINDEEKQSGVSSKCCKKTIVRLIHGLSREGLLKLFTTTVVQDGITKKVDLVVHPSIEPSDEIVKQVIEQVRFKISSSYTAVRLQHAEESARDQKTKDDRKKGGNKDDSEFKPTIVRGLSKTFGFQPKMPRLRVVHTFLWYLIYGHPLQQSSACTDSTSQTQTSQNNSDPDAKDTDSFAKQHLKEMENSTSDSAGSSSVDQQAEDSRVHNFDVISGDEGEEPKDKSVPGPSDMKVYVDDDSWKRFVPPVRLHKDYTRGWAMVGDLLLCLPLSIFVQVIQVNYQVDGLEDYLNDPVMQHHLVRTLPARMRRQLLYKRKYIFFFNESLQKLVYMGLLQYGPTTKFKEKDQVFVYLRRNTTIIDTTNADPHYWLITESPDKPFERRKYTLDTAEDVENYWFDLMCVCLNTPLGLIRGKRNATDEESAPSFVHERYVFVGMAYLLKGNHEACDDGSIPGDGKGAGGLDSEFFAHLKRNWLWTNHLLAVKSSPTGSEAQETKNRLKSLLSRNVLRIALKAGGTTAPRYVTAKRPLVVENVKVAIEPSSRNQQVVGGKGQKRRRSKKDVTKPPRKKRKEPKKRTPAHDEADHKALKMMTKQRVYWSIQEDSLMMLCSVASHLFNSKLKRPFVPHCVVRDMLHAEFEISMDKTSLAVGRRSRYILKNPQTLLNYRICLAEVFQDETLMRLLEENKPTVPDSPEDCAKAFSEYIRLLRQKFSCVLSAGDLIMPDTKQQLFSRFKVSAIDDRRKVSPRDTISCTEDIHAIVLHNLIQSTLAMTNSQMKSSRSFQAFHMYSKYNQELLCRVFIECRKRGLVNRRRVNQPFGPKKNRALPILPMSYQLSQSYYRCFSWRFPQSLCTDSFCFLRNLINNGRGDDRPLIEFYHETENRSQTEDEMLESTTGPKRKEKQGKEGDRSVSEAEVQSERTTGDSTKEADNNHDTEEGEETLEADKKDEENEVMSKSDEQTNPDGCLTSGSGEAASGKEQTDDLLPMEAPPETPATSSAATRASEGPPDVSDMLQFSLFSPGGACVVSLSLMSLGLLSVHLSIPKQMVVVDSSLVDNDVVKSMATLEEEDDDDDDGEDCEGRKKLQVTAHQASHTNYLIMRGYCSPGIVKIRNLNTSDNIVVESCIMRLLLRNTPAHHVFSIQDSPPLDLTKCGPSLLPSILTYFVHSPSTSRPSVEECNSRFIQQRGYTPQDIEACDQLRRSLHGAGKNGLDVHDLHKAHMDLQEPQSGRTRSLQQYMQDFQEEGQAVTVGSLGVRWVLMQHAEPWLLTVNPKQWSQLHNTSDGLPSLENPYRRSFVHKRCNREIRQDTEEPPAKRLAVDGDKGSDVEEVDVLPNNITKEKINAEQQQKETEDEESGGKQVNLEEEGRRQTQADDEGKEKGETEKRRDNTEDLRVGEHSLDGEKDDKKCSPDQGSPHDDMSFIGRPWRMVDGTLNRPVCKGMLEAILYHIMSRPGLTQQRLMEHYKDLLQPRAVLDLVKALIDMGCVTKKTLVKSPKPSLFSCSAHQTRSETKMKIEEPDTIYYEPTICCCLRLCQVLPNERHWNQCTP